MFDGEVLVGLESTFTSKARAAQLKHPLDVSRPILFDESDSSLRSFIREHLKLDLTAEQCQALIKADVDNRLVLEFNLFRTTEQLLNLCQVQLLLHAIQANDFVSTSFLVSLGFEVLPVHVHALTEWTSDRLVDFVVDTYENAFVDDFLI